MNYIKLIKNIARRPNAENRKIVMITYAIMFRLCDVCGCDNQYLLLHFCDSTGTG